MDILFTTPRLSVRPFVLEDAPFVLELLNTPGWLQYIGDRNIRSLNDAREYLLNGPLHSYDRYGFGGWLVSLRETDAPAGICGLFRRDYLDQPDLGFALLPAYEGKGLAAEMAAATMVYARRALDYRQLYAIVQEDNQRSIRLLLRCGFKLHKKLELEHEPTGILLFEAKL